MKKLLLTATLAALALSATAPVQAGLVADGVYGIDALMDATFDKRSKPRIPGGSGCDDPEDILEHPECRV